MLANLIKQILAEIGEDPARHGLAKTPERTAEGLKKLFRGYEVKVEDLLRSVHHEEAVSDSLILIPEIDIFSMCEHHFLPMFGKAQIAYIPNKKIAGIGSINAIVEAFTLRLQLQERITSQIANAIFDSKLEPKGVAIMLEMSHFCAIAKGSTTPHKMKTTLFLGEMQNPERKSEFLSLI